MNESVTKHSDQRIHRSESEIRELLSEYEASRGAMSVSEFCDLYEIGESTFYNWQRRYTQVSEGDSGSFIPLDDLLEHNPAGESSPAFTITLEGGHVLRYHGEAGAGFLRELLGIGGAR